MTKIQNNNVLKIDVPVKRHETDDTVKSSRCTEKRANLWEWRRTYKYVEMTKDKAQHSPSTLLRAVSLSNGKWTFYEVVNF